MNVTKDIPVDTLSKTFGISTRSGNSKEVFDSKFWVWAHLGSAILINAFFYSFLRILGFVENFSLSVAVVAVMLSLLIPSLLFQQPTQVKERVYWVSRWIYLPLTLGMTLISILNIRSVGLWIGVTIPISFILSQLAIDRVKVLADKFKIEKAQRDFALTFNKTLAEYPFETIPISVNLSGSVYKVQARWFSKLNFWAYLDEGQNPVSNKYLNIFGIGKPNVNSNPPVICYINIPKSGNPTDIAGRFVVNKKGNIFIAHRGDIGSDIPIKFFRKEYRHGIWKQVERKKKGKKLRVLIIGELNSPDFGENFLYFITEVKRIKEKWLKLKQQ